MPLIFKTSHNAIFSGTRTENWVRVPEPILGYPTTRDTRPSPNTVSKIHNARRVSGVKYNKSVSLDKQSEQEQEKHSDKHMGLCDQKKLN